MKPANFAPAYLGLYPELAEVTRSHGYALAAHGSMARDFDLICIPWIEDASEPDVVVKAIIREHGRIVYTLSISFGECFLDFSFMPLKKGIAHD
jgi:hypothetical protein